jgi:hypothetical protein
MAGREKIAVPRSELEHIRDELHAMQQLIDIVGKNRPAFDELQSAVDAVSRKRVDITMLRMRLDALLGGDPDKTPVRPPSGTFLAAVEEPKER